MIEVQHISKAFGSKAVLNNVSCAMESGKVNLIIGSSGSGKTVLIKCIVGLLPVDHGAVLYEGQDFVTMNDRDRKQMRTQIGMLFQGSALFDSLTVEQNVMFPLDMFTTMGVSEKKKRVNEVLDRVNLVDTNLKFPAELSGGMKKRVALARAIVLNPKYLFCDEPNSGLDPQTSLVIDKLILEITRDYKITTIMNTHDMNTVMEAGDHIVYLHKGQKQWEGSSDEIIFSEDPYLNDFIFASQFFKDAKDMRILQVKNKTAQP